MNRQLIAPMLLACCLAAGCGQKEQDDSPEVYKYDANAPDLDKIPALPPLHSGDKAGPSAPRGAQTIAADQFEKELEKAAAGVKLERREFKLNGLHDRHRFTMLVPEGTKDDWLGGLMLDNKNNFSLSLDIDSGFNSRPVRGQFDSDHVVVQTSNTIVFQDSYRDSYWFRAIVPLGLIDLHVSSGHSEQVKPTLQNRLLSLYCARTVQPVFEVESEPMEALRQIGWRVIERDGNVTEVRYHDGHFNDFISPRALALAASFPHLEVLAVQMKAFMNDDTCETVAKATGLRELIIDEGGESKITDKGFAALGKLTKLRVLRLGMSGVGDEGLATLAAMPDLEDLKLHGDVGGGNIRGPGLAHVAKLTKLHTLDLDWSSVTDDSLALLKPLTGLRRLSLSVGYGNKSPLTDKAVEHILAFAELEELTLSHTALTDEGLKKLAGLKKLKKLNVSDTKVTDAGLAALKEALPELKIEKR